MSAMLGNYADYIAANAAEIPGKIAVRGRHTRLYLW